MGTNYYARTASCPHCGRGDDELHIGKSMRMLQALSRPKIESMADWRTFLDRPEVTVWDEYGTPLNLDSSIEVNAWLNKWTRYESVDDWRERDRYADIYMSKGDYLDAQGYHMVIGEFS